MYNTPELLLVGAAQHLVLGESFNANLDSLAECQPDVLEGTEGYQDRESW